MRKSATKPRPRFSIASQCPGCEAKSRRPVTSELCASCSLLKIYSEKPSVRKMDYSPSPAYAASTRTGDYGVYWGTGRPIIFFCKKDALAKAKKIRLFCREQLKKLAQVEGK